MDMTTRLLVSVALVLCGVGIIDASISREWDLLVLFALIAAVQAVLWIRQGANRVTVTIRSDLAHWVERQSHVTGEPHDDVLDRAIATYKSGMYADEQAGG